MDLNGNEIAIILQTFGGVKQSVIADAAGYAQDENGARSFRRRVNRPDGGKLKQRYYRALTAKLYEHVRMPWDTIWCYPLADLHALRDVRDINQIVDRYQPWAEIVSHPEQYDAYERNPERRRFFLGLLYLAAHYHMSLALHPRKADNPRDHKTKSLNLFSIVAEMLSDDEPVHRIFKTKCVGNIVALQWNTTNKGERDTPEMRQLLADMEFFARMKAQNELFPRLDTAPFAALAIASVLNMEDLFRPLHEALKKANPNFMNYEEFDQDFDNFKRWLNRQEPTATADQRKVDMRKTHQKKAAIGLAAIWLLGAVSLFDVVRPAIHPEIKSDIVDVRPFSRKAEQTIAASDIRPFEKTV